MRSNAYPIRVLEKWREMPGEIWSWANYDKLADLLGPGSNVGTIRVSLGYLARVGLADRTKTDVNLAKHNRQTWVYALTEKGRTATRAEVLELLDKLSSDRVARMKERAVARATDAGPAPAPSQATLPLATMPTHNFYRARNLPEGIWQCKAGKLTRLADGAWVILAGRAVPAEEAAALRDALAKLGKF